MEAYHRGVHDATEQAEQEAESLRDEMEARLQAKIEYAEIQERELLGRVTSNLKRQLVQRKSADKAPCGSEQEAVATCFSAGDALACESMVKALQECARSNLVASVAR